jgi:23S rRNA (cytosine1962-C5)-methyltransferase
MAATRNCSICRPNRIADAPDATAYRLIHGDLAVDRFDDVAVIHARSEQALRHSLPALRDHLGDFTTVYAKVHTRAGQGRTELVRGPSRERVEVVEHGVRYEVRPESGLNVGLFLDMREVRQWVRAHASERTVLNLFAYSCSFGVVASLGGASRVLNIDLSKPYLEWGKVNYGLNGLAVDERDFVFGDALDWLSRFARRRALWGMVIADPPSFSSTPFSITRDYARLVALSAQVVSPGGVLLAAANHAGTSDVRFDAWIAEGLAAAARRGTEIERWHEPTVDFPVPHGGRPYLKVRALALA